MPWVRFTAPFDWRPKVGVVVAYPAGAVLLVTTACAHAAGAAGAAVATHRPERLHDRRG